MTDVPNPPAFPCEAKGDRSVPPEHDYIQTGIYSAKFPGMTLRDWFAGQAALPAIGLAEQMHPKEASPMPAAARIAYEFADAMLLARTKSEAGE